MIVIGHTAGVLCFGELHRQQANVLNSANRAMKLTEHVATIKHNSYRARSWQMNHARNNTINIKGGNFFIYDNEIKLNGCNAYFSF